VNTPNISAFSNQYRYPFYVVGIRQLMAVKHIWNKLHRSNLILGYIFFLSIMETIFVFSQTMGWLFSSWSNLLPRFLRKRGVFWPPDSTVAKTICLLRSRFPRTWPFIPWSTRHVLHGFVLLTCYRIHQKVRYKNSVAIDMYHLGTPLI